MDTRISRFSINSSFKCEFLTLDKWYQYISSSDIAKVEQLSFDWQKISHSVDIVINHLKNLREQEESPDIVICAPPRKLMDICISAQDRIWHGQGRKWSSSKKVVLIYINVHYWSLYLNSNKSMPNFFRSEQLKISIICSSPEP